MSRRPKRAVFVIVALALLYEGSAPRATHAQSPVCGFPAGYPGDLAPAASIAARATRIAAGDPFFGQDSNQWGEWIADVERPAEHLRGRYQLALEEARTLMRLGCGTAGR